LTEVRRVYRFALAGVAGFAVDAAVLFLTLGILGPYLGRALSFLAAVAATWAINRRYAFADRASGNSLAVEFLSYLTAMLAGGLVNLGTYALIVGTLGSSGVILFAGVAAGSLAGMVVNLILARFLVFRHQR
jgi:putative flippase GtrA